jgi:hypothetical protein
MFDGSTIVDPVVVSSSFWRGLQSQIISALLGQFLAAIIFSVVASFFASQLSNLKDNIVSQFTQKQGSNVDVDRKRFVKATDLPKTSSTDASPDFGKLLVCLAIDVIGSSSELVPLLGEVSDFVWAPIAATVLQNLFGSNRILFFLELTEEILPFTDIIPLATLAWVIDTYFGDSDIAQLLNLGKFSPSYDRTETRSTGTTRRQKDVEPRRSLNGIIDVKAEKFQDEE